MKHLERNTFWDRKSSAITRVHPSGVNPSGFYKRLTPEFQRGGVNPSGFYGEAGFIAQAPKNTPWL
jgi:hypothetical protein